MRRPVKGRTLTIGKSAPSAPAAPDPTVTAAAQTASNVQTAQTQAALNRVNQVTPYGSLTYSQPDPNNPNQYTATQALSPQEQNLLNLSQQAQTTYGNIGNSQLNQVASSLSQPINTNYDDVRNQTIQAQMSLIQPQLDLQKQTLQSQLANQGVAQGSTAWQNAMQAQTNSQNQMYANVLSNAGNTTGQAIQQQESLRDQPLNEASALLSGSQVQQPQFTQVPQTQVSPTDVLGAYGQQQQAQEFAYQQQMANYGGALGGIGGLVGSLGGAAMLKYSDERLKTDIKQVGELNTDQGTVPIKTFRFKGDPVRRLGFIAQDVEDTHPDAVATHPVTGLKALNYARVLQGVR